MSILGNQQAALYQQLHAANAALHQVDARRLEMERVLVAQGDHCERYERRFEEQGRALEAGECTNVGRLVDRRARGDSFGAFCGALYSAQSNILISSF